jgi:hypothetical protein
MGSRPNRHRCKNRKLRQKNRPKNLLTMMPCFLPDCMAIGPKSFGKKTKNSSSRWEKGEPFGTGHEDANWASIKTRTVQELVTFAEESILSTVAHPDPLIDTAPGSDSRSPRHAHGIEQGGDQSCKWQGQRMGDPAQTMETRRTKGAHRNLALRTNPSQSMRTRRIVLMATSCRKSPYSECLSRIAHHIVLVRCRSIPHRPRRKSADSDGGGPNQGRETPQKAVNE